MEHCLFLFYFYANHFINYKYRLSRQWQYYIWLVAVVRLLFPFTLQISLIGNLFQHIDQTIVQIRTNEQTDNTILPDTGFAKYEHLMKSNLI